MMPALAMIGEHFDDPTARDLAMRTTAQHARQLGFERAELRDFFVDLGEPRPREAVGLMTRLLRMVLQRQ